jgi:hypothetical protein
MLPTHQHLLLLPRSQPINTCCSCHAPNLSTLTAFYHKVNKEFNHHRARTKAGGAMMMPGGGMLAGGRAETHTGGYMSYSTIHPHCTLMMCNTTHSHCTLMMCNTTPTLYTVQHTLVPTW